MRVTLHALQRWQERVDKTAGLLDAEEGIRAMLETGSRSTKARPWLRQRNGTVLGGAGGGTYVYNVAWPKTALVIAGGSVVTVMTQEAAMAPTGWIEGMGDPTRRSRRYVEIRRRARKASS